MFQILKDLFNGSLCADWKDGNLPDDFIFYVLAKFWPVVLLIVVGIFIWQYRLHGG